jgi:hypothetical protein
MPAPIGNKNAQKYAEKLYHQICFKLPKEDFVEFKNHVGPTGWSEFIRKSIKQSIQDERILDK